MCPFVVRYVIGVEMSRPKSFECVLKNVVRIYMQLMPGITQHPTRHLQVKGTSKPQPEDQQFFIHSGDNTDQNGGRYPILGA